LRTSRHTNEGVAGRSSGRTGRPRAATVALSVALACGGLATTAAGASANVLTVDDDLAQCSSADYTSLVEAVAMASQGDDIRICDGVYTVPGGDADPANGITPSAGLRIEKNVDLIGAGADKVFVQPSSAAPSMAAATPNERDEFGNVITVKRRSVELADITISGLTVRGNGTAAEAGIAMIDVNESHIHDVRVTGIAPGTGPGTGLFATAPLSGSGHGIVLANTIEGTVNEATVDRVAVDGFNKAGVVVDSRTLAGTAERTNTMRATISDSTITGAGTSPVVAQDGVEGWGKSTTIALHRNLITGVAAPAATPPATGVVVGQAAGVYLRGVNPATTIGGSRANANTISGNTFGAYAGTFDGSAPAPVAIDARSNYWGSSNGPSLPPTKSAGDFAGAGAPNYGAGLTTAPFLGTAPAAPVAPAAAADAAPSARFDTLTDGAKTTVGTPVRLDVVATDDFGVKNVEYFVDGVSIGSTATFPYEFAWTPDAAADGAVHRVSAVVTDSAGQTKELAALVQVGELPVPAPAPTTPAPTTPAPTTPAPAACPVPVTSLKLPGRSVRIPSRKALKGTTIVRAIPVGITVSGRSTVTVTAKVKYRYKGKVRTTSLRMAKGSLPAKKANVAILVAPNGTTTRLPAGRAVSVTLKVSTKAQCAGSKTVSKTRTFRTKITRIGVVR
jgi:hypothetical protein